MDLTGMGAMVLNWFFESEEVYAPDGIAAHSEAFVISRDCCRYSFGHVIWADVLTL
jgi:hypothetical protein